LCGLRRSNILMHPSIQMFLGTTAERRRGDKMASRTANIRNPGALRPQRGRKPSTPWQIDITYKNVVPRLPHANDASSFWLCCGGEPPTADRTRSHPVPASAQTADLLASCPPDLVGTRIAKLHTWAHRGLRLEVADPARPAAT
jgi:hypothetical protein